MPMKPTTFPLSRRALHARSLQLALAAAFSATLLGSLPHAALAQTAARAPASDGVVLNFVNTELESVVRALGQFTGRNFLVDPRVKGQLTLVSEAPVNREIAYRMLLGALRMQGFAVVESGGISRVVPEADAKLQGSPVNVNQPNHGQLVTRVFKLDYENAANLVPVLRPMIAPNNPINAYPGNNTLVITDYADNLQRIAQVIASVDTPSAVATDLIEVKEAIASDIAAMVNKVLEPAGGADQAQRVTVVADPRTNSVLVRASSPARAQLARDLIARLDSPSARSSTMHVVYLKNAEAVKLAEVLRGMLTGQTGGSSALGGSTFNTSLNQTSGLTPASANPSSTLGGNTMGLNTTPSLSSGTQATATSFSAGHATVMADPTTNTLIITAPEPMYRSLREVIDLLDVRRAQIFVESLIVEVTTDTASEFGIQWLTGLGNSGRSIIGGTSFGGAGSNILTTAANLGSVGAGLSIGIADGTVNVPGVGDVTNLGVLARALENQSGGNILSTPNLLTLDNEEASIIIGQNVPFITGQYAQTSNTSTVSPFQTIERKDVGLTLKVKPQVSEGGTVKMTIYQEVSSVDNTQVNAAGIITNKRAIESNVLVDDGQIIVIGGLVQDTVSGGEQKVPLLGDIPYLGALFRYDNRRRSKTNLMVFLRPYVIRDGDAQNQLMVDRYEYMRTQQAMTQPGSHWLLPDMQAPLLPPRIPAVGDVLPPGPDGQPGMPQATTVPQQMNVLQSISPDIVLQAATVATEHDAQIAARRLLDAGLQPEILQTETGIYRVQLRLDRERATVDATLLQLRQLGFSAQVVGQL